MDNTKAKVIIFNGPPGSGKDEATKCLLRHDPERVIHKEFKTQLFKHTIDLFDVDKELFFTLYNDRGTKEEPSIHLTLDGTTLYSPREALIYTSEVVYKPKYGKMYFGQCSAKELTDPTKVYVFSDGGFAEEVEPIVEVVGASNIVYVQLYRENCTFEGDSRNYVWPNHGINIQQILNHGDERFHQDVIWMYGGAVRKWFN